MSDQFYLPLIGLCKKGRANTGKDYFYFRRFCISPDRDVLFEFRLKFWNTASIGVPVRSYKVDRL